MKFKVGDIVEISHDFKIGEEVKTHKHVGCSLPYYRNDGSKVQGDIIRTSDMKLVSVDKVLTIITSADKTTLTDGTHTTMIKRYHDDKPNEQNAVAIVIDKYYQELKDIEKAEKLPKVGDTVKIIDDGETYPTYDTWFTKYNIDIKYALKWKCGESPNDGEIYKIVAIHPHGEFRNTTLALVKDKRNCYIINIEGIEVVK